VAQRNHHGTCKLCSNEAKLCKSHIIPEFLHKGIYEENGRCEVLRIDLEAKYRIQKGYRENLLCESCETHINDLFEKPVLPFFEQIPDHVDDQYYKVDQIPNELPLFAISVFWRASVAQGKGWAIKLGPHQEKLKEILLKPSLYDHKTYPVYGFMPKFDNNNIAKGIVSSTAIEGNMDGHRLHSFLAGGLQFTMKASSHSLSDLTGKELMPGQPYSFLVETLDLMMTSPVSETPRLKRLKQERRMARV
jgi:hypothetical protein